MGFLQAADLGEDVARLLNHGFPMQSALSIATDANMPSEQYLTVGDAGMELVETHCDVPITIDTTTCGDTISVEIFSYPTVSSPVGTLMTTNIDSQAVHSLSSTNFQQEVDAETLNDFFANATNPVYSNESIRWTNEMTADDI